MKNKKICLVISNYDNVGGTERVTSQIANELCDRGYDVSIVSFGKGLHPVFDTDERIRLFECGVDLDRIKWIIPLTYRIPRWIRLPVALFNKVLVYIHTIYKKIYGRKLAKKMLKPILPDAVLAVDVKIYAYIFPAQKVMKFKTVAWEHFALFSPRGKFVDNARKLALKHANRIVVLSDRDREDYSKAFPKANHILRMYNPMAYEPCHGIDLNQRVVVASGRFVKQKGFDLLIQAWSKIADQVPDWELRIFGDGEDREMLQSLIDQNNLSNVKLCGFTNKMDEEMKKASVFVFSSRFEGWGLVLLEALAVGLPCVSFACKNGPSEIIDDGVNGFLVPPEDVDAFAEKLLLLMQDGDLRAAFSEKAHKDLYRFDIKTVGDEWEKLLENL